MQASSVIKPKSSSLMLAVTIVVLVSLWQAVIQLGFISSNILPTPLSVAYVMPLMISLASGHFAETLVKMAASFAVSISLGVGLGLLVGSFRYLYQVLNMYLAALYSIPKIFFLPLFIVWIGLGNGPILAFAIFHATVPILLLTISGIRDLDTSLITVARSMGCSQFQIYSKVILPALMPVVITGLRLGVILSLGGVLVGEMFLAGSGLGYLMWIYSFSLKTPELYASTIYMIAVIVVILVVLNKLEKNYRAKRGY